MDRSVGKKIAVYACVGLVFSFLAIALRGFFSDMDARQSFGLLSDAFFTPAAVLGGLSALSWMRRGGEYDTLSYGVAQLYYRLPLVNKEHLTEGFYEFKERKKKQRGEWEPYSLWVAGIFAALALFCLGMYVLLGRSGGAS